MAGPSSRSLVTDVPLKNIRRPMISMMKRHVPHVSMVAFCHPSTDQTTFLDSEDHAFDADPTKPAKNVQCPNTSSENVVGAVTCGPMSCEEPMAASDADLGAQQDRLGKIGLGSSTRPCSLLGRGNTRILAKRSL